jgi:quercetin dioxygenase-like cupin family protein
MSGQKVKIISLDGDAKYKRLLGGAPETRGMKSGYVILQPGESVGAHSTGSKEEAIIILEGELQVILDGKFCMTACSGQVLYIPPETQHDMKNAADSAARYIYVVAPVL